MRVLFTVLVAVSSTTAYDAIVFSNEQQITRMLKDFPTIPNLISTASAESPLVFIVNPDFTLGRLFVSNCYSLVVYLPIARSATN
ncbi:hypothetical protein GCK32_012413 [Trichostrongylus colubriformis]|uniref:Uncharacterized protein n=1 Tax=Trichostrongylus colubriformis TaxID=6319 RepID=A0AAN8G847_TRICO